MSSKNYYVSYYDAIIKRNLTKATNLKILGVKEKNSYSDELGDKKYDAIFKDQDPDDVTDELLKKVEFKDFKKSLVEKIKKLSSAFQIDLYKAIANSDMESFAKLQKLNSSEVLEYKPLYETKENEYDEIFQDNLPNDAIMKKFIESFDINKYLSYLSNNDPEFYQETLLNINGLEDLETFNSQQEIYQDMLKNPLINYCPNPALGLNILDSLASVTYSKYFTYKEFAEGLYNVLNKHPFFVAALSIIALYPSAIPNQDKPFSIMLVGENLSKFDPSFEDSTGGHRDFVNNRIVFSNFEGQINFEYLIHEALHQDFSILCDENLIKSEPYRIDDKNRADLYHKAIKTVLLNVRDFIKRKFDFSLRINDDESSWQIAKKLALLLFPEQQSGTGLLDEYLKLFDENNLDKSASFHWLDNFSSVTKVLAETRFDLANELIKLGFKTLKNEFLEALEELHSNQLVLKDTDIFSWFLSQKDFDPNFKDKDGKTALDYSNDKEIFQGLIMAGAQVYPADYSKICSVNPNYVLKEELSIETKEYLEIIKWFLGFYIQGYQEQNEDEEFIVRLPQKMVSYSFKEETTNTLKPLIDFMEEGFMPDSSDFVAKNDPSGICLPFFEYGVVF